MSKEKNNNVITSERDWPECEFSSSKIGGNEETISELIRKKRTAMGMSITKLSEVSGVSRAFIVRLEEGKRPNVSNLIKNRIFDALQIDVYPIQENSTIDLKTLLVSENIEIKYGDYTLGDWVKEEIDKLMLGILEMLSND